jgi:hypothetical protein
MPRRLSDFITSSASVKTDLVLFPCPKCAGDPEMRSKGKSAFVVGCRKCNFACKTNTTPESAACDWNTGAA